MNAVKSLCVAIVLSALGYGAYVTLTGKADHPLPADATNWDAAPEVQLPGVASGDDPASTGMTASPASGSTPADTPKYLAPMAAPADDPLRSEMTSSAPGSSLPGESITALDASRADSSTGLAAPTVPIARLGEGIDTTSPLAPDPHDEFSLAWGESQKLLDQGKLGDALLVLSEFVTNSQMSPVDRDRLLERVDQLAGTVIYSREHLLEPPYTVQPGDTLEKIGERYGVAWQLLGKINGIAEGQPIRPGDQLKVMRGPFDALVSLRDFEMTLFLYGHYAGRFRIGVGQDQTTPEGELTVQNKVVNPTYYGPGQMIAPNDPANPLGGRWIDLGNRLGIHGTNDPASIGRAESRGCIRLSPSDVADVYDILSVGSRVTIWK